MNGWSTILNNPFYIGLIRIRKTGEVFQGIHPPLVGKYAFDGVQAVLKGKMTHRTMTHRFRFQRTFRCAACNRALIGETRKGHVYYRCHTASCPVTNFREEAIDATLRENCRPFQLTDEEWEAVRHDIGVALEYKKHDAVGKTKVLTLNIAAIDERVNRLTDAYVDRLVERDIYLTRKAALLDDKATLLSRKTLIEAEGGDLRQQIEKNLGLAKALGTLGILKDDEKTREILKTTTSDLIASPETLYVAWRNPFQELAKRAGIPLGGPYRGKPRTFVYGVYAEVILKYSDDAVGSEANDDFRLAA
jgi:hypothetical protein